MRNDTDWSIMAICVIPLIICAVLLFATIWGGVDSHRNGTPVPTPCPLVLPMPGHPAILLPVCGGSK